MVLIDDYWSGEPFPKGTCVVFGGRGFVGRSLVYRLLKLRKWIVRVADCAPSLHLDLSTQSDSALSQAISAGCASYHCVDVRDKSQITGVIDGSNAVFYFDVSGSYDEDFYTSYMNIVQGTKNIITACQGCKVKRLIYDSSADVIFDGSCDISNANESIPHPWKYKDMWSDLKAQAEALVLIANNIDGLLTCALRSCNVFGPGDTEFVPFLLSHAKFGWTKFITGTGENMSDFTYVENVAHAHICAEEALVSSPVSVAGKAFFISNNEPMKFWKFVSLIVERLGYKRPVVKVPVWMAYNIFLLVQWIHEELGTAKQSKLRSAHYMVSLASRTRTFDCSAAQEKIGYSPVVSLEEGISETVESFAHLARDTLSAGGYSDVDELSKADKLLGSGKVADVLLWRDEKTTFTYFLASVVLFYWFFLSGRSVVTSTALLLLTATMICFTCGFLPGDVVGFHIPMASSSNFEMEESTLREAVGIIASIWNRGFDVIRYLRVGGDWDVFFKVVASLCVLKWIFRNCLNAAVGTALVLAFTCFYMYEQYEYEIDLVAKALLNRRKKNSKGRVICRYVPAIAIIILLSILSNA